MNSQSFCGVGSRVFDPRGPVPCAPASNCGTPVCPTCPPGPPGPPGPGVQVNPIVLYTSGTPANPMFLNLPAMAADPTGVLPLLIWNPANSSWN